MSGSLLIDPPPGVATLPDYDGGWLIAGGQRQPFLSYVTENGEVNWSEDLERLHEECSRSHFLDQWTRNAIIARLGTLAPAATIVDVGCSTGYLLEDLAARYADARLVGVDMVAAGLHKAHAVLPQARLLRADACNLPFESSSIDAVVSANLLEHVADDSRALAEIERILRPSHLAVLVVPAGPGTFDYYDRFLGHERRYARRELVSKARAVGLVPVEQAYLGSLLYPAFWAVKRYNRLRYDSLSGPALEQRVAMNIARTHDSRLARLTRQLEERLSRVRLRAPFGIRMVVVVRKRG